uniref:BAR domain-containing protein n=1 Tax=Panagrellus redivivus TaxID=6233 RepID=A0A7E4VHR3_PANRE
MSQPTSTDKEHTSANPSTDPTKEAAPATPAPSSAPTSEQPGANVPTAAAEPPEAPPPPPPEAKPTPTPAPAAAPPPPAAPTAATQNATTPQTTQPTEDKPPKPMASPAPNGSAENVTVPPQPLELQAAANGKEDVGAFKKLFWKINEKVGKVKTSAFSKEYMAAVTEFDTYNALLKDLIHALTSIIQQNPDFVPDEEKRRSNIDAPAGEDPYELLAKALDTYAPVSADKKELQKTIETAKKVASQHREFQQKARRSFHQIRTFLRVDVEFMNVERTEVVKSRQHFDIATYEVEKNPGSSWKRSGLERARKAYDAQCRKVIDYVREMAEKRAQHRIELLRFLQEYRNFSESTAREFEKYAAILAKIPPNPTTSPSNSNR